MASKKRPPNTVEVTPSGLVIAFWDSVGVDGERQQRRYRVAVLEEDAERTAEAIELAALDAVKFVNVSTAVNALAKEALLGWVERLTKEGKDWREERAAAMERGQDSHDLILRFLLGQRVSLGDLDEEHRPWGQAGFRWLRDRKPKVERAEAMVACPTHSYAGRPDLVAEVEGIRTLVDYKTLTKWSYKRKDGVETEELYPPYNENLLQLDLYQGALIESGFEAPERGLVVRLGPDGNYDETFFDDLDPERGIAVLGAYRANLAAGTAVRAAYKATRTRLAVDAQLEAGLEAVPA